MTDFQPGYPVGVRAGAMRARDARSPAGDVELAAARVIARLTGERVVLQDDNSADAMVEIRIEHRGRLAAYAAVVTDLHEAWPGWRMPYGRGVVLVGRTD